MSAVLVWFFIGVAFILGELFTPAFVIVFFGAGAWAAAVAAAVGLGLEIEVGVFIFVSLAALLLLRQRLLKIFKGNVSESGGDDSPAFSYAGRMAEVTEAISANGVGEVSLGGSFWRATASVALPKGSMVMVEGTVPENSLLLRVKKMETPEQE